MTALSRRPALRWLVPLVAALLLVAGGSAAELVSASARGDLPARSASQLLADVQRARVDGLSGTVAQTSALGLPSLPQTGGPDNGAATSPLALLTGSHTLRVWYAGPNRVRLAVLDTLGESDLVRNGTSLWTWSSRDRTATHRTVPLSPAQPRSLTSRSPLTPQQAADAALTALTPSTQVSVSSNAVVAGRPAYELVLRPRDAATLVGSVRIAVDGATHIPTRVQVFARGSATPAFSVAFTSFDPTTPSPSVFDFTPPPGTKVTQGAAPGTHGPSGSSGPFAGGAHGTMPKPTVVGKGWTSVMIGHVPPGALSAGGPAGQLLGALPRASGSWGSGRVWRGTVFSAVVTTDGRIAVGAVTPQALFMALAHR